MFEIKAIKINGMDKVVFEASCFVNTLEEVGKEYYDFRNSKTNYTIIKVERLTDHKVIAFYQARWNDEWFYL